MAREVPGGDGIVNCAVCCDPAPAADKIEISGPHILIACSPEVMAIVERKRAMQAAHWSARSAGGTHWDGYVVS
jgi:hypothetical protein